MFKSVKKRKLIRYSISIAAGIFLIWFLFFSLPAIPFDVPYSKVIYSQEGYLLNAQVAKDEQWRFPADKQVSKRFEQCILMFEDRGFYHHIGISPKGISRAVVQNIKNGKIVSGGSTISMQTIRLMRKNPGRTWHEKIYEMILALRLELRYSKKEILQLYAAHAPFGNNVVGIEAASWRYFGKATRTLTWGENALLAVLPNAPGLLYPGKNHDHLLAKRNKLLQILYKEKIIDKETFDLSISEPIPDKPLPLPDMARHYFMSQDNKDPLQFRIQKQCLRIADNFAQKYQGNQVQNIAIIVSDLKTGKILAYVGNTHKKWSPETSFVDCANAPRSTGSILKPLLYYKSLSEGIIAPTSMLLDVPVSYNHFTPQNYARTYEGLIPAKKALAKSLNIPMVGLLEAYGLQKFHANLRQMGFRHINRAASNYGLSLILGSGEVTLKELNFSYNRWAGNLLKPDYNVQDKACIYETLEAMTELNRPDENGNWKTFMNTQKIAWKTGTSFGNRDAWCVGISSSYVVSVWVGNADGSGRTGLTGIEYAAPVLFDVFNALPRNYRWFTKPSAGYKDVLLCKASGYKAGPYCEDATLVPLPASCNLICVCPFHQSLTVDQDERFQVNASVCDWQKIKKRNYFVLSPVVATHYKSWNPAYKYPPAWHPEVASTGHELSILFPDKSKILLFGNNSEMIVNFKASVFPAEGTLYWHVDNQYIGTTTDIHEVKYTLAAGKHQLMILDQYGHEQHTEFEVVKTP